MTEPEDAGDRLARDLDKLIGEGLVRYQGSEMGRGPEIEPPEGPPRNPAHDVGYTADGRAVEVPAPELDPRTPAEKMMDAKQAHLAQALAGLVRDADDKKRRAGLTQAPETRAKEKEAREAAAREVEQPKARSVEMTYDSPARRAALARYMEAQGVSPELQAIRLLGEVGQAKPPEDAVKRAAEKEALAKEERDNPSRGVEPRGQEPPGIEPQGK